jgi:HEAT repeat protein
MGEPAVEPLIEVLGTDDRQLRGFISLALCRIGKPAVGPLSRRLSDPDEVIRSCAALTLWQMGEGGVQELVEKTRKEPPE